MTRLVILTVAALAVSSVVASAQTTNVSQKTYVERAPVASWYSEPLIFGVTY